MSKRIVLVDAFGFELFSGESKLVPPEPEPQPAHDARQGGPFESGIFDRETLPAPAPKKTRTAA